ncbi:MAG TPA: SPFH domain-containing protein [Candidatus Adamsella sp.]|nr:SPFH domain-containing protein [Candidatus Adamsella sp.]
MFIALIVVIFILIVVIVALQLRNAMKKYNNFDKNADILLQTLNMSINFTIKDILTSDNNKISAKIALKYKILNSDSAFKKTTNVGELAEKLTKASIRTMSKNISEQEIFTEETAKKLQSLINQTALKYGVRITEITINNFENTEN